MKKILAVSALVSLIPLASISIVSCKNSETNNQEQWNPTIPDAPEINNPSTDQNNPSEGGNSNPGTGGSGDSNTGAGGSGSDNSDNTLERGILSVKSSSLSYTADSGGKWWINLWISGSNLSDNINHYKFYAKDKNDKIIKIPNEYFKVQSIDTYGGYGYFTQRQVNGGPNADLFNWMKEQIINKNYGAIIVEPAREDIKPTNVQQKPSNDGNQQQAQINTYKLQKTYGIAQYERAIVVNGTNLPSDWSRYELKWHSAQNEVVIPSNLFRNSMYNIGNYQVFVLKSTADQKFVDEFDRILSMQNKNAKEFFELTLKQ